ncbi:hypothetical protein EIO60_01666|nr:hypothetical protein [Candidatus Pantoea persica]
MAYGRLSDKRLFSRFSEAKMARRSVKHAECIKWRQVF